MNTVYSLHYHLKPCLMLWIRRLRHIIETGAVNLKQTALPPDMQLTVRLNQIPELLGRDIQLCESNPEENHVPS